jgi:hypothetical protein
LHRHDHRRCDCGHAELLGRDKGKHGSSFAMGLNSRLPGVITIPESSEQTTKPLVKVILTVKL